MKTRKQGNAIVLTIPSKFGIAENVEYLAVKGSDDSITFIKKEKNIFDEAVQNNQRIDMEDEFADTGEVGRELF